MNFKIICRSEMQFAVFDAVINASERGDNFTVAGNINSYFAAPFANASQHAVFGKHNHIVAVAQNLLSQTVRQFSEKFGRKRSEEHTSELQSLY